MFPAVDEFPFEITLDISLDGIFNLNLNIRQPF